MLLIAAPWRRQAVPHLVSPRLIWFTLAAGVLLEYATPCCVERSSILSTVESVRSSDNCSIRSITRSSRNGGCNDSSGIYCCLARLDAWLFDQRSSAPPVQGMLSLGSCSWRCLCCRVSTARGLTSPAGSKQAGKGVLVHVPIP